MISTTQTLTQIKSLGFIAHIKQHFMTINPLNILLNAGVHLELWPDNMLFGKLQPTALTWYAVDLRSISVDGTLGTLHTAIDQNIEVKMYQQNYN